MLPCFDTDISNEDGKMGPVKFALTFRQKYPKLDNSVHLSELDIRARVDVFTFPCDPCYREVRYYIVGDGEVTLPLLAVPVPEGFRRDIHGHHLPSPAVGVYELNVLRGIFHNHAGG